MERIPKDMSIVPSGDVEDIAGNSKVKALPSRLINDRLRHHPEIDWTSGARRTTSSAMTILSFADLHRESSANMSLPPAISISSETQAIPEIIGLSHSSKYTFGLWLSRIARCRISASPAANKSASLLARSRAPTSAPSVQNHIKNFGDGSLIECVDVDAFPNQLRGDLGLEIRKGQD